MLIGQLTFSGQSGDKITGNIIIHPTFGQKATAVLEHHSLLHRLVCDLMHRVIFNLEGRWVQIRTIISIYCGLRDPAKIVHTLICLGFG